MLKQIWKNLFKNWENLKTNLRQLCKNIRKFLVSSQLLVSLGSPPWLAWGGI